MQAGELDIHAKVTVRIREYVKSEDGAWVETLTRYMTTAGRMAVGDFAQKVCRLAFWTSRSRKKRYPS